MDNEAKKKYCHLMMVDIFEPASSSTSQETSSAAATKQRKPQEKITKRPPRPPNAFILYRQAKLDDVIANNVNLTSAQISKVISEMWWRENEEEKFQWEKRADRIKLKHMQDYPDFVYQPKKPTRKRKSTKRGNKSIDNINGIMSPTLSPALPDETAIADVAFTVGNKFNQSMPFTFPVSPLLNALSPLSSINQLSHRVNQLKLQQHAVYTQYPPSTEVY